MANVKLENGLVLLLLTVMLLSTVQASLIDVVNEGINKSTNINTPLSGESPTDYGCYKENGNWYCPEPKAVNKSVLIKFTTDLLCLSSNLNAYNCAPDECGSFMDYGCGATVEVMSEATVDSCFTIINDSGFNGDTCSKVKWEKGTELYPFILTGAVDFSKCSREKGNLSVTFKCPMKGKTVIGYFTVAGDSDYPTLMLWKEKSLIDYDTIAIVIVAIIALGIVYYFKKNKKNYYLKSKKGKTITKVRTKRERATRRMRR